MSTANMIRLAGQRYGGAHARRDDFAACRPAADRDPRVPLPAGAGLTGGAEGRRRAGGTDQKFNLLMGRGLQKHGQPPQIVLTMPLLEA